MSQRILIVEDDTKLAPLVQRFLEDNHDRVTWSADGERGWRDFESFALDLAPRER